MRDNPTFLPAKQVRDRYVVSDMSLWRWMHDKELGFPQPLRINNRRFWKLADLEAWEASKAKDAAEAVVAGRDAYAFAAAE